MNIVKPYISIIEDSAPTYEEVLKMFNHGARTCYQSESEKTNNKESAEKLARVLIKAGHGASLEFNMIPVDILADRSFMGQLTRNRHMSFMIQSLRYYDAKKHDVDVIVPHDMTNEGYEYWRALCMMAETTYIELRERGCKPETARSILPMCTATRIVCSANIREWRHVLELRCDSHAQIDMQVLMKDLLRQLYNKYPVFFEDLAERYLEDGANN